ncbi:MAG: peptide-methionine (R)-S-oxide reductase MsrB [Alphaproteobacteria bacterium]|nr:peptide-methionine (R)-S-oxide reductase MsrB [Alphaproteobacteria bacterium]
MNAVARLPESNRRTFLVFGAALLGASAASGLPRIALAASGDIWVTIETFSPAGQDLGSARVQKVVKSEANWKKQLPAKSFEITRHAATEPPFTGIYWNNHADGLYRCICCDTAVFDSRTKFESGTGWPSFYQPISRRNVAQLPDSSLGMSRIAVSCARCDGHLGHVFDDGPKPTGLRYCMNSASLRFVGRGKEQA